MEIKDVRNLKYQPKPLGENDEVFQLVYAVWNVTRARKWIEENPGGAQEGFFKVESYAYIAGLIGTSDEHVGKVDIAVPVILAEWCPGEHVIIDGNHRARKALRDGVERIPCLTLGFLDQMQFVDGYSSFEWLRRRALEKLEKGS